jgi:integrase
MAVITKESKLSLENQEQEILFNFINSLKSPVTKEIYNGNIKHYLKYCNLTKLSELLTIQQPQKQIIKYIMFLREKQLATTSINTMLYAIYHFYDMNDITLNKKKINSFKGESTRKVTDRAYFHEEIQKILNVSDLRMKVIVLLMASAGLRVGAITSLKLRNLEKVESCYKITVYEGTNEQYYSFCTPECALFIDSYLEYRTKQGERLGPDSYLIRDQFNINDLEQIRNKSKGIQTGTLKVMLNLLLVKAGVREVNHTGHKRKEVARAHGFRKFFTTQMIKSKVIYENRLMMEGHSLGITDHYARIDVQTNFLEYQKAIDNLTIDPANRLVKQIKILEIEKTRLDTLEQSLKKLEQKYKTNESKDSLENL